jgi:DNA-binding response OmpR family regulator
MGASQGEVSRRTGVVIGCSREGERRALAHWAASGSLRPVVCRDGSQWLAQSRKDDVALAVIDNGFCGNTGATLLGELRRMDDSISVLYIADEEESENPEAIFELGASDFVRRPVLTGELLGRAKALMRRSSGVFLSPSVRVGVLEIDLIGIQARLAGQPLGLTRTEHRLAVLLFRNAGRVIRPGEIIAQVFEGLADERVVRFHVCNLRQ